MHRNLRIHCVVNGKVAAQAINVQHAVIITRSNLHCCYHFHRCLMDSVPVVIATTGNFSIIVVVVDMLTMVGPLW